MEISVSEFAVHNQEKNNPSFGEKEAGEILTEYGNGSSESQKPGASYGEGSTIVFNKLPPGTIIREKIGYTDDNRGPAYLWRCVGEYHPETKKQDLWVALGNDCYGPTFTSESPFAVQNQPVTSDQADGNVEMTVGKKSGNITDMWLRQAVKNDFDEPRRKTLQVDVMSWGRKRGGGENRRVEVGKLVPKLSPVGMTI